MTDMEMVDIIAEDGTIGCQELKAKAHDNGWLHKIVIGYLRSGDDWLLVRQASDKQDAGQLVAPVGGHVQASEPEISALLRESEEEIGTSNITYRRIGSAVFHRQVIGRDENHLFIVYEIATEDSIVLGNESVSIERFTPDGLKQSILDQPQEFGEAFYFNLEKFYPDYLPVTWQNRWDNVSSTP